jgi:hypothetical protein
METMRGAIAALVTLVSLAAAPAFADNQLDEARQHFKRGTELYDEGNFRGALVEFQRAYELSPNYKLLYNMGQVYLELQDYAKAGTFLQRYLSEGGNEVPKARADEVGKEVERLKGRVGQISVDTAPGQEVLIDDESVGFAPLPAPPTVSIGRHKVTVMVNGTPINRMVDVAGMQTLQVVLAKEGGGAVAGVSGSSGGGGSRPAVIGLWVATGALAVGAAVMAGLSFSASGQLNTLRNTLGVSKDALATQASSVFTQSIIADTLTGLAVVCGAIAIVFTVSGGSSSAPAEAPHVSFGVGPSGFSVAGTFW